MPNPTSGMCLMREFGDPGVGLPGYWNTVTVEFFLKRFLRSNLGIFDAIFMEDGALKRLVKESLLVDALSFRLFQVEGGVEAMGVWVRGDDVLHTGGDTDGGVLTTSVAREGRGEEGSCVC
jgi:hypothetical protein